MGDSLQCPFFIGLLMRILLIEDDRMIGSAVSESLKEAAYAVDWVTDGEAGLAATSCQNYDLLLVDLGLPRIDGIELLQKLRRQKNAVSFIILTARDAIEDRIAGLDNGADDYLVKPFALNELHARIRAVLRRQTPLHAGPMLGNGVLQLNPVTREASRDNGPSLCLSAREFALLQALLIRPGAILSRSELEEKIYGWDSEVESNAVEFLIHSLRKKFGSDTIKNVRGLGWMVAKQH